MSDFDAIMKDDFSIDSDDLEQESNKEDFTLDLGSLKESLGGAAILGQEYSAGDSLSTFRNATATRRENMANAAETRREGGSSVSEDSGRSKARKTRSAASSVSSVSTAAATVARIEKDMVEMKSKADDGMERMQSQMDALTLGINQLTQAFLKQNNSTQPADSQGAAAGHDK